MQKDMLHSVKEYGFEYFRSLIFPGVAETLLHK